MVQCRHYSLCTTVNFTMALHHLILNKADIFGQLYLFQVYQLYFVKYIIFGTEALLHEYKGKNTNVLILIIIIQTESQCGIHCKACCVKTFKNTCILSRVQRKSYFKFAFQVSIEKVKIENKNDLVSYCSARYLCNLNCR